MIIAKNKAKVLKKEITLQFVTNGTLLSSEVVDCLQRENILFGVSVDGCKIIHDLHRKGKGGLDTFDCVMRNVSQIQKRQFLGVACTLTDDVFDMVDSLVFF